MIFGSASIMFFVITLPVGTISALFLLAGLVVGSGLADALVQLTELNITNTTTTYCVTSNLTTACNITNTTTLTSFF